MLCFVVSGWIVNGSLIICEIMEPNNIIYSMSVTSLRFVINYVPLPSGYTYSIDKLFPFSHHKVLASFFNLVETTCKGRCQISHRTVLPSCKNVA